MSPSRQYANPFHALLVAVGIAFTVSACAYGVMSVRRMDPSRDSGGPTRSEQLVETLDRHGATVLLVELFALAAIAAAAMGTDAYWKRRAGTHQCRESTPLVPPDSEESGRMK